MVALLGLGHRYLPSASPALRYASEASYPFYLWHQTVVVLIGFWVVQWHASVAVKYGVIVVAGLLVTLAVYECAVRRWNIMRFVCGMRRHPPAWSSGSWSKVTSATGHLAGRAETRWQPMGSSSSREA
ncbi:MAG TPA: hypothetical protein VKV73_29400 [Chloroflexota bacterium]|nr:hypothetical protein [Chloroflexota bacterium]